MKREQKNKFKESFMKKYKKLAILALAVVIAFAFVNCDDGGGGSSSVYKVGDTGPGGGIIFYVDSSGFTYYTNADDTTGIKAYYLEASPADVPELLHWGPASFGFEVYQMEGTETDIGTGMRNTKRIIAAGEALKLSYEATPAAKACDVFLFGSKADWFLPSLDELALMYENLHLDGLGDFSATHYWSSSRGGGMGAWFHRFDTGGQGTITYGSFRVRPIRAL
jgi:hypothetical protein